MPKKKKLSQQFCRDCDVNFIIPAYILPRNVHCPVCADYVRVEKVRDVWMETDFVYKKEWTEQEKQMVIDGVRGGYTYGEIADSLTGRTERAVIRQWKLLKKQYGFTDKVKKRKRVMKSEGNRV